MDQHGAAVAKLVAAAELKGMDIALDGGTMFYTACWGGDAGAAFVEGLKELEKLGVELARVRAPQPCRATRPALVCLFSRRWRDRSFPLPYD